MRRGVLTGLLLGALLFAGAVGAKVVNVSNPMATDLDAAQHSIYNADTFDTLPGHDGFVRTTKYVLFSVDGPNIVAQLTWTAGSADPNTAAVAAHPGSLYSRRIDADNGELWIETGPGPTTWQRVALAP